MKRLFLTVIHILSLIGILATFFTIKYKYPDVNINNIFNLPKFENTTKYNEITDNKIKDTFKFFDYTEIYENNENHNIKTLINFDSNTSSTEHYQNFTKLKNDFKDGNSNFTYIIRYYDDEKQKEFYNNEATLNMILNSESYLYISNKTNKLYKNINIDEDTILTELKKRLPYENMNYYFACGINNNTNINDEYTIAYNQYIIDKNELNKHINVLFVFTIIFIVAFMLIIISYLLTNKKEQKSNNMILNIPTEILFIIYILLLIISNIILPNSLLINNISSLTNTNSFIFIQSTIFYILSFILIILLCEKNIALCNPEPKFILKGFATIGTDMSKISKNVPIFSYIFFFLIPIFLLGGFTIYCFYNYNTTKTSFVLLTAYVCTILLVLFILFIIIINFGFIKTINNSENSDKMKYNLITNVSHDIRTPLTSIINYTDILSKEIKSSNKNIPLMEHHIEILVDKSNRLKKLIDDLIYSTKASSGNLSLNLQKLDIIELTHQFLSDYDEKFKKRELNVVKDFKNTPLYIYADGDKIYRVYENIFDNIIKYALQATNVKININSSTNKYVNIKISNISSSDINFSSDLLTDRFVRGDLSRNTEGFGLGLSIVNDLSKLMGGEILINYEKTTKEFVVELHYKQYNGF